MISREKAPAKAKPFLRLLESSPALDVDTEPGAVCTSKALGHPRKRPSRSEHPNPVNFLPKGRDH